MCLRQARSALLALVSVGASAVPYTAAAGAHRDCTQLGGVSFVVRKVVLPETRPHPTLVSEQHERKSERKATRGGKRGSSTTRVVRGVAPAVSPEAEKPAVKPMVRL